MNNRDKSWEETQNPTPQQMFMERLRYVEAQNKLLVKTIEGLRLGAPLILPRPAAPKGLWDEIMEWLSRYLRECTLPDWIQKDGCIPVHTLKGAEHDLASILFKYQPLHNETLRGELDKMVILNETDRSPMTPWGSGYSTCITEIKDALRRHPIEKLGELADRKDRWINRIKKENGYWVIEFRGSNVRAAARITAKELVQTEFEAMLYLSGLPTKEKP